MRVKKLTSTQAHVLNILIRSILEKNCYPLVRELKDELQINSLRGVTIHLDALERKRYIVRLPNVPRGMMVLRDTLGNRIKFVTKMVVENEG